MAWTRKTAHYNVIDRKKPGSGFMVAELRYVSELMSPRGIVLVTNINVILLNKPHRNVSPQRHHNQKLRKPLFKRI